MSTSASLSQVIRGFTTLSQALEIEHDKEALDYQQQIKHIQSKWTPKAPPTKEKKEKETAKKSVDTVKNIDDHRLTWPEFQAKHSLRPDSLKTGLTTEEAVQRNLEQGDNVLQEKKVTPWYVKLFMEFVTLFAILMWVGAVACFVIYGLVPTDPTTLYTGVVLIIVITITALITFFQNSKSESIMDGFKNFIPQMSTVMRNGREESVLSAKLVRGDIILVKEGQRIAADIRIIQSQEMKVDNSSLTGESEALTRSDICDHPDKILETKNVAFFGTMCKYGQGKGVVFNIGEMTVIGQIANLVSEGGSQETPLRREINRFIIFIAIIAVCFGIVLFCLGFILNYTILQNFVFAIGIIVANVPEGLLPTITIALAVSALRLSKRNVLVKNLESVETLGSTSCICSDKTGTLTQNVMTVENLWYGLKIRRGDNPEIVGNNFKFEYSQQDPDFQALIKSGILNTAAVFSDSMPDDEVKRLETIKEKQPEKFENAKRQAEADWTLKLKSLPYSKRPVIGDASETALVKFFQPLSDIKNYRSQFEVGKQTDDSDALIPFNSSYKFALVVYRIQDDPLHDYEVLMKGAPERIWDKCTRVLVNGQEATINDLEREEFAKANKVFAKNGERVLGFARLRLPKSDFPAGYRYIIKDPFNLPFANFAFVGLISLVDPPKLTVPDAIEKCKSAGIKVIMVTGDQMLTATSIAKRIGIIDGKSSLDIAEDLGISNEEAIELSDAIVVDGVMLTAAQAEDDALPEVEQGKKLERWLKKDQIVFARTSPAQKLYIVKGCQRLGHIVGVTGDGVNDSPAIKQADIGISMGITGSDVAKDSADMILLDDDFSSILTGIQEGRRIFDNLKKTIVYMLSVNIPELMAFLIMIVAAVPLPLSTILVLCLSVGTDIFPAIGIGFEEAEIDVMTRAPRSPNSHLVDIRLVVFAYCVLGGIEAVAGFTAYFVVMNDYGFPPRSVVGLLQVPYFPHGPTDVYSPSLANFGNSNIFCKGNSLEAYWVDDSRSSTTETFGNSNINGYSVDYQFNMDSFQDMRMGYIRSPCPTLLVESAVKWGSCRFHQINSINGLPVCYTPEALKYAQSAFFVAVVFAQFVNSICAKTKFNSVIYQPLSNSMMILGWIVELILCFAICYLRPIQIAFLSRAVPFLQFGFYGALFGVYLFFFDEIRKLLIRRWPAPAHRPNWFYLRTMI